MYRIFIIILILFPVKILCQTLSSEGLFAAGDSYGNSTAQISWTLGDGQTSTVRSKDLILTQGFLQSHFTLVGVNQVTENESFDFKVFPNPVHDILNLKYVSDKKIEFYVELFNLEGKKLYADKLISTQNSATIHFDAFQSGYYILKIRSEDNKFSKSYKLFYQY